MLPNRKGIIPKQGKNNPKYGGGFEGHPKYKTFSDHVPPPTKNSPIFCKTPGYGNTDHRDQTKDQNLLWVHHGNIPYRFSYYAAHLEVIRTQPSVEEPSDDDKMSDDGDDAGGESGEYELMAWQYRKTKTAESVLLDIG